MREKREDKLNEKVDERMDDLARLKENKMAILKQSFLQHGDFLKRKLEMITANNRLVGEKLDQTRKKNLVKLSEKYSYFPFTEGEDLEKER
jgi:hypothetical protein